MAKNHIAVFFTDDTKRDFIVEQIAKNNILKSLVDLIDLKGDLYSLNSMNYYIKEELIHDHYLIPSPNHNTFAFLSDGEKKRELLSYIINQNPDYIIIDNVFDSLDINVQQEILDVLQQISDNIIIIQVFNRKLDLLPFIENVFLVEEYKFLTRNQFAEINLESAVSISQKLPPPIKKIIDIDGPLVKFNLVSVIYDERCILKNISWEINSGDFWHLLGPNGSGKSTLLSMIIGENPKAFGEDLTLFGRKKGSGETVWQIKQKIGYFTSSISNQFERMDSIEKMIISGYFDSIGLYVKPSDHHINLAKQWLLLIGMYEKRKKLFLDLSLCHQRLILIIRAMVKHPLLLILDEPTAGLNDHDSNIIIQLINKIATESNVAIIYVSHRLELGIKPHKVFKLTASVNGSTGEVVERS